MATRTDSDATTIRVATRHDTPEIHNLLQRAYAEFAATFPWPGVWNSYYASVADVVGRWGDSTVLVAERGDDVIGSVDYHAPGVGVYSHPETTDLVVPADRAHVELDPTWAAVRCLAVDPDRRGTGAARALMAELIERARRDGAAIVFLHSAPNMTSAIGLYSDLGFVRMPERDFRIIGGGPAAVLGFRLDLRSA